MPRRGPFKVKLYPPVAAAQDAIGELAEALAARKRGVRAARDHL
jgi:hypothetical protein